MCEFGETTNISLIGSGRTRKEGWFNLEEAQVYHDHFIDAPVAEGIVIDILELQDPHNPLRLCLELDTESARNLAQALLHTLDIIKSKRSCKNK